MFSGFAVTALFAVLAFSGWRWQQASLADSRLSALLEKKDEVARLDGALRDYLAHEPDGTAGAAETRAQLLDVQKQFEALDEEIGTESIALAKAHSGSGDEGDALVFEGDRLFAQGRVSAALAAYEQSQREHVPAATTDLKLGLLYDFNGSPLRAMESYQRYLETRPDAPDKLEVSQRIDRLYQEVASVAPVDATGAAATPKPTASPADAKKPAATPPPAATQAPPTW
jgi:tetratricopeptide (TPR) repeat protein